MIVLALEGPSFAGKSTLAKRISQRWPSIRCFADYVEMLNWENIPAFDPGSSEGQARAFLRFMEGEARRVEAVRRELPAVVLLDRSIDTLLAHAFSLDGLFGYGSLPLVRQALSRMDFLRPNYEFFLDTPREILLKRQAQREDGDEVAEFIASDFLGASREYFDSGCAVAENFEILHVDDYISGIPSKVELVVKWVL